MNQLAAARRRGGVVGSSVLETGLRAILDQMLNAAIHSAPI